MKKFAKILTICALVLGVAVFAGCTRKNKTAEVKSIKVGCVMAATHPTTAAMMETFKPMVEAGTNGAIQVQVFEAGLLGGERDLYNSVKNGSLDVVTLGTGMWDEFNKMLIPDWPFLYRDLQHARAVFTGDIANEIATEFSSTIGVMMVPVWGPNGARIFSSNKAINTPADFKGQRIRMPNNPIHLRLATLLGANAISMNLDDVFGALEQKVIDGQDNPIATVRANGWYEVQKYIYETNHMVSTIEILLSNKFMDSLTPEQKEVVISAAKAAMEDSWDRYISSLDADRAYLTTQGMTVVQPTEADRAEMIAAMAPLYEELSAKYDWAGELTRRVSEVQ